MHCVIQSLQSWLLQTDQNMWLPTNNYILETVEIKSNQIKSNGAWEEEENVLGWKKTDKQHSKMHAAKDFICKWK